MKIVAVKTRKITDKDTNILDVIDSYIDTLEERSILCITSKIISICEGRIIQTEKADKDELIKQESEYFLEKSENKYGFSLTITQNLLIPTAGIDESNGNGYYILWPKNPQKTANDIREHLTKKYNKKHIGIIITDSKTSPLRWGTTGVAIAHSGFKALNTYIGKSDLFDKTMRVTESNIMDGIAAAAVCVMGEGREQTPLALVTDTENVQFQERNPTEEELDHLKIDIDTDLYSSLLKLAPWKKGEKSNS